MHEPSSFSWFCGLCQFWLLPASLSVLRLLCHVLVKYAGVSCVNVGGGQSTLFPCQPWSEPDPDKIRGSPGKILGATKKMNSCTKHFATK